MPQPENGSRKVCAHQSAFSLFQSANRGHSEPSPPKKAQLRAFISGRVWRHSQQRNRVPLKQQPQPTRETQKNLPRGCLQLKCAAGEPLQVILFLTGPKSTLLSAGSVLLPGCAVQAPAWCYLWVSTALLVLVGSGGRRDEGFV